MDTRYLQSLEENRNSVFQVISNFNGLESLNEFHQPGTSNLNFYLICLFFLKGDPTFTENYSKDKTQGCTASISAGAAAISRVYAAFADKSIPQQEWGQSPGKQVYISFSFNWRKIDSIRLNFWKI